MKRVLVFYGYYEYWDAKFESWERNLYDKNSLLKKLSDSIDDVIIIENMNDLKQYLNGQGKDCKNYILPSLTWHVQELLHAGVKSLFSVSPHSYDKLINKKSFSKYLEENNFLQYSPRIYSMTSNRDSDQLVIVKHSCSAGSKGTTKKPLRQVEDWEFNEYIVQEYIHGSEEYDACFVLNKGVITLAFAYVCGFENPEHIKFQEGSKITSYKKIVLDDKIKSIIEEILKPTCFTGTCCFDFKIKNGEMRIFEINPRLNGALASSWNKDDLVNVIRTLIQNSD